MALVSRVEERVGGHSSRADVRVITRGVDIRAWIHGMVGTKGRGAIECSTLRRGTGLRLASDAGVRYDVKVREMAERVVGSGHRRRRKKRTG